MGPGYKPGRRSVFSGSSADCPEGAYYNHEVPSSGIKNINTLTLSDEFSLLNQELYQIRVRKLLHRVSGYADYGVSVQYPAALLVRH